MAKNQINILSIFRQILFVCVFYSVLIKPVISFVKLVDEVNNEIIYIDVEENSSNDENQESGDEEEEFKKNNFSSSYFLGIIFFNKKLVLHKFNLLQDISLDVHLRPPKNT